MFIDLEFLLLELDLEDLINGPELYTFTWDYCHLGLCDPDCNHSDAESQDSSSESMEESDDEPMEENYDSDEMAMQGNPDDKEMERSQDRSEENTVSFDDKPATWEELIQSDDED